MSLKGVPLTATFDMLKFNDVRVEFNDKPMIEFTDNFDGLSDVEKFEVLRFARQMFEDMIREINKNLGFPKEDL